MALANLLGEIGRSRLPDSELHAMKATSLFPSASVSNPTRSRSPYQELTGGKPLPAPIPLLIHLCSESPNLSRMMKALLSASLLLVLLSPVELRSQLLNKCTSSDNCFSGNYSFTAGDGKFFEMKKHCCNTVLCKNAILSLPDHSVLTENGLKCPTCFSKGTAECESEKTIDCLGNETQCVVFKGALHIDPALDGYLPINIVLRNNAVWRQDKFAKSLLSEKKRPPFISTISRSKAVEQQIFVPSTEENLELGDMSFLLPKKYVIMLQESHTSLNMKGK
ncbi:uncharacterized protein LOC128419205 [Podarcis raffonei]|uniref:uncharacterized protein LOC128419205 n=1 Tax=Podarcis raffonei TaxID=65483 RepID=UPI0023291BBF|nr:uncharacterized protein LOC128419205 [Podarcis raffonei]